MEEIPNESIKLFLIRFKAIPYDEGDYINVLFRRFFIDYDTFMMPIPVVDASFFGIPFTKFLLSVKLDGTRCLVVSDDTRSYIVLRNRTIFVCDLIHNAFKNVVFDCEIVGQDLWILDVVTYNNARARHFALRFSYLRQLKIDGGLGIFVQSYIPLALFKTRHSNVKEGIIFTRIDGEYNNSVSTVYKFKNVESCSVDLKVKNGIILTGDDLQLGYLSVPDGIYEFDAMGNIVMSRIKNRADSYDSVVALYNCRINFTDVMSWEYDDKKNVNRGVEAIFVEKYKAPPPPIVPVKEKTLSCTIASEVKIESPPVQVMNKYKVKVAGLHRNDFNGCWKSRNLDFYNPELDSDEDDDVMFTVLRIPEWGLDRDMVNQFVASGNELHRERNSVVDYGGENKVKKELIVSKGLLKRGSRNYKYRKKK